MSVCPFCLLERRKIHSWVFGCLGGWVFFGSKGKKYKIKERKGGGRRLVVVGSMVVVLKAFFFLLLLLFCFCVFVFFFCFFVCVFLEMDGECW